MYWDIGQETASEMSGNFLLGRQRIFDFSSYTPLVDLKIVVLFHTMAFGGAAGHIPCVANTVISKAC